MSAHQVDWIGQSERPKSRVEFPNQRALIAERKAVLCLQIRRACAVVPASVKSGGVVKVRSWKGDLDDALGMAAKQRSSVPELESALGRICQHLSAEELQKVYA